jgi:ABC transporter substrate binding protein
VHFPLRWYCHHETTKIHHHSGGSSSDPTRGEGNADSAIAILEMREVAAMASTLGLEVVIADDIRQAENFAPAFEALKGRAEALYIANDPLVDANRTHIITLANGARLPTMYSHREHVTAGGLISFGPSFADLWRRAADFVDKILRDRTPVDIPVEQPTKFDLVINLITAKALGITVPRMLLGRVDEVIEQHGPCRLVAALTCQLKLRASVQRGKADLLGVPCVRQPLQWLIKY